MRELFLSETHSDPAIGKNVFTQLSLAFPTGLVCSSLQKLKFHSSRHWLPFLRYFLSPTLAEIEIFATPSNGPFQSPPPAIPILPGSYLRSLQLSLRPADDEASGKSASATILQCGAFLENLEASVRLSEAAVSHLIGLRHLRTLRIGSDPPSVPAVPSSDILPSLESLTLDHGVGHKWLSFLGAAQENSPTETGIRATLTNLSCLGGITVDPVFISSLCLFPKLTHVLVNGACSKEGGCTFLLTDEDVANLADALPEIKRLELGSPCSANRCHTTALSLFTLSTHCLQLKTLEIHFNTTGIGHVLDRLFKEPQYGRMRSLPRCPLRYLTVGDTQISTRDMEFVTVYFSGMFHGLQGFRGGDRKWIEESRKVKLLYNFRLQIAPDTCIVSAILLHLFLPAPDGRRS